MKNILIPTDFSDTSKDAFLYAQSFVREATNFVVLHAYHPQFDPTYPYIGEVNDVFFETKENELKAFAQNNHRQEDGNIMVATYVSPLLKIGLAGDIVVEESQKEIDLIIMGRTGSNSVFEKVFGTVSIQVAQQAHCPVLLVPKGTTFNGIEKIIFATNQSIKNEEPVIHRLLTIVKDYQPEIHFVQVKDDIFNYHNIEEEEQDLLAIFQEDAPNLDFKIVKIKSDDAMESLHEYAEQEAIDLCVLATKHRGVLAQLFHTSSTKEMILNSQIPLMVMHYG